MKPVLFDFYCGAGGATRGYQLSGFHVVGVDNVEQPNYCGDEFYCADALEVLAELARGGWAEHTREGIVGCHASPPCQAFSRLRFFHPDKDYPRLVGPTRQALAALGLPSIIENVPSAGLRADVTLCGEMFGLRLHRHRHFETHDCFVMQPPHQPHRLRAARHNCHIEDGHTRVVVGNYKDHGSAAEAMGIDWMTREELAEAIPPAYTEHIGDYLMAEARAAA